MKDREGRKEGKGERIGKKERNLAEGGKTECRKGSEGRTYGTGGR